MKTFLLALLILLILTGCNWPPAEKHIQEVHIQEIPVSRGTGDLYPGPWESIVVLFATFLIVATPIILKGVNDGTA